MLMGAAGTLLIAGGVLAQQPAHKPTVKIREAQARATALARVPKAHVQSEELEHEAGRWIYSYDLKVPGRAGIDEVNVDAMTGKIVAVQHENPKAEKQEKATEGEH
jgi:uncharacterized membrane protein YkoI